MASRHTVKSWVARDYIDPLVRREFPRPRPIRRLTIDGDVRSYALVPAVRVGLSNRHRPTVTVRRVG